MRKFKSNEPSLRDGTTNEDILLSDKIKALRVCWNPVTDALSFSSVNLISGVKTSKRGILTTIAKLSDPTGLLAPIIVIPKIIIQQLWLLGLSWDDPIPSEIQLKWIEFKSSLKHIDQVKIPRFILTTDYIHIELHGFADASEQAYRGACIYVKSVSIDNTIKIHLLAAKSRVAPTKPATIPRLIAATLLTELPKSKFKSILKFKIDKTYYWTDSKIVLARINSHPNKWVEFVANRVAFIQENTEIQHWNHVTSADNPADILSRGMLPDQLANKGLWLGGPSFLKEESKSYPCSQDLANIDVPEEKRRTNNYCLSFISTSLTDFEKHSDLTKINRITAWIYRFINNCNTPKILCKSGMKLNQPQTFCSKSSKCNLSRRNIPNCPKDNRLSQRVLCLVSTLS